MQWTDKAQHSQQALPHQGIVSIGLQFSTKKINMTFWLGR